MGIELRWHYADKLGCEVAQVSPTVRVRAPRDEHPENPFLTCEMEWPIAIRQHGGDFQDYETTDGPLVRNPLERFGDHLLVHWQHHIAKLLNTSVFKMIEVYLTEEPVKHCTDADVLRDGFKQAIDDTSDNNFFKLCKGLYDLLGIPAYVTVSRGYSQGDWAEVLVVATPEAVDKFGTNIEHFRDEAKADPAILKIDPQFWPAWIEGQVAERMLKPTVDLYGWWAWGDVYGYVIEEWSANPRYPEDMQDEGAWEEIDSCYGYYGPDHTKSGLEEHAIQALPDHTFMKAVSYG